jgi:hypothetical protein
MKKIVLIAFLVYTYSTSFGQITISKNDMPVASDTARYSTSISFLNFTNTGPNYTWDYSSLITTGQGIDTFSSALSINPIFWLTFGLTDFGTRSANDLATYFSLLGISNAYDFYKTSNSYYEINGLGASYNNLPIPFLYSIPEKVYQFPLSFGRIDNTNFALSLAIPGIGGLYQTGTRANTVDGWGTVITPYDTFQCLRLKSVVNEVDSIGLDSVNLSLPITTTTYKWLAHGSIIPVLEVQGIEAFNTFVPTSIKFKDHIRPTTPLYNLTIDFTANHTVCTTTDVVTITPTVNPVYVLTPSYQYSIYPSTFTYVNGTNSNSKRPQVTFTAPGLYTVSLFVTANALTTNTTADTTKINYILVTYPTGVAQTIVENPIKAYPNPANEELSCKLDGDASKKVTLELSDISGRIVYTMTASQNGIVNIPTAQLPAGEYLFKATPEGEKGYTQKVTVVH